MIKPRLQPDFDPNQAYSDSSQEGFLKTTGLPTRAAKNRYTLHAVNVERRSPGNTVFHFDEDAFVSSLPRASHWSIAWSDLMMTMFVLFLSMYAYQAANERFLAKKAPEIIGGDTTEAMQTLDSSGATFPFVPIHPGLPLMTGGTVKKVKQIQLDPQDPDAVYPTEAQQPEIQESGKTEKKISAESTSIEADQSSLPLKMESTTTPQDIIAEPSVTSAGILSPPPSGIEESQPAKVDQFQEIYTLSKESLKSNNLSKFAAIDIVPDKTMRIILTGDLLFALGESELSEDAKSLLQKVVGVLQHTPYMINVVGHTDNLPMHSDRFTSNWELSVARASTVARFLIEEIGMNPNQFVVSGYSSYRPIVPNTTAENRARNRRVEIIISKRLPNPLPATTQNLK